MKKLIGTVAVAALLASAAFAEISFGSWLRVVAAPVMGNGDDIYSGMTNSWGYGARTARVDINGASEDEKVGFSMSVFNDADNGITAGDNKVIWAKPWDWLRISLGAWDYTTFRGDLCYGSWNWIRPNNWIIEDEGLTFDKLGAKSGMQLEITPIDGLVIMWNLPMGTTLDARNDNKEPLWTNWKESYKMLEQSDAAVKYTIGSVGTIKAGWGGQGKRNGDDYKYYGDVNVAFDLTAVENLYITVGAKISLANSDYKKMVCLEAKKQEEKSFAFIKAALGASYQILDNLSVAASFGLQTYQVETGNSDYSVKRKPDFQFGVGVNFGITDTLTLNADFRGLIKGDWDVAGVDVDGGDPQFSFLVGLQYNISSNGYVGIGFQGTTNGCGFLNQLGYEDKFAWAVPIAVSCWF